jgi:hypothetical protein
MGVNIGYVTVDDLGNVTKTGVAGAYYDALYAQEAPQLPDPNTPSSNFSGTAGAWKERINNALTQVYKGLARQANAMAEGGLGYSGGDKATASGETVQLVSFSAKPHTAYLAEVFVIGVETDESTVYRHYLHASMCFNTLGGSNIQQDVWTALHEYTTGTTIISKSTSGGNLIISATGTSSIPMRWRAQLKINSAFSLEV